jgi:hypothetical protein
MRCVNSDREWRFEASQKVRSNRLAMPLIDSSVQMREVCQTYDGAILKTRYSVWKPVDRRPLSAQTV